MKPGPKSADLSTYQSRFWQKVDKASGVFKLVRGELSECWLWTGGKSKQGYGIAWTGSLVLAHRLAYEWEYGVVPPEQLDHLCRTRACVRPHHLEEVTNQVNAIRGVGIPARNIQKTHCPRGHPYTPENTYSRPSRPGRKYGSRQCRVCIQARSKGLL